MTYIIYRDYDTSGIAVIAWLKYFKNVLTRMFSLLFMCHNESNNAKK